MSQKKNLVFAHNDPRSAHLVKRLRERVATLQVVEFDDLNPLLKYPAAALSFHRHRLAWWLRYQWHPVTQHARSMVVNRVISRSPIRMDAILMWGSWFSCAGASPAGKLPMFHYIDQSCAPEVDAGDEVLPSVNGARRRFNLLQRRFYESAERVFCMSDWCVRQTLSSHPGMERKLTRVGWGPIGVNLSGSRIPARSSRRVLFVGHEFERKGVDILRQAADLVWSRHPDVVFRVIGKNIHGMPIDATPRFQIVGSVSDKAAMAAEYREAAVFVLPHRFDRSPHVLAEAMSASLPIVTSRQGGAPEAVEDGHNGYLVEVGDFRALATRISELLESDVLRETMGANSLAKMKADFNWDTIADLIITGIDQALRGPVRGN